MARNIQKRLTVVNKDNGTNKERINLVLNRHLEKMSKKGWIPTRLSGGNAFFLYENIVWMSKPKNDEEKNHAEELAKITGFYKDGEIWAW